MKKRKLILLKYPSGRWFIKKIYFENSILYKYNNNEFFLIKINLINILYTILDPDLGIPILDLGLLYTYSLKKSLILNKFKVNLNLTLTSISCPSGSTIIKKIKYAVLSIKNVSFVKINIL
ncbi:DUF59 domain-containing protein [Candidatus Pinguicoccus supinus]|uniref:DUF59 domain-containing protein n=1 Tax=Candidatus Pinguicoccus supinus TaxID=2529394 RepID=A0A7T0FY14_9BACT|nr:DUF59 domain-containing protein [Candidatus Pinguicoccus supinus]